MFVIPAFGKQIQEDQEFKVSLLYKFKASQGYNRNNPQYHSTQPLPHQVKASVPMSLPSSTDLPCPVVYVVHHSLDSSSPTVSILSVSLICFPCSTYVCTWGFAWKLLPRCPQGCSLGSCGLHSYPINKAHLNTPLKSTEHTCPLIPVYSHSGTFPGRGSWG